MSTFKRGRSKDASYQIVIHLARQFQRRRFHRNQPIRKKNGLWRSCLLTDRNEMSNLYRGPSIDASYQVLDHLVKWLQRRRFLQIGQSEKIIACGGHVCWWIRTFHRCFLPSVSSFGRRISEEKIKMWKVNRWRTTDDGCQVMAKAHIAFGKVS
jgi:hypothetical protein